MSSNTATPLTTPDHRLDPAKFKDPQFTARGERRAVVALTRLRTLWFNTGSLCNITCVNCFMESSPRNDALVYLTAAEVEAFLEEIDRERLPVEEIGFTGGEPFMNPQILDMLESVLARGLRALVLTNAMKPLHHKRDGLLDLRRRYGDALMVRVSIDHYSRDKHEAIRGENSWQPMIEGLRWLAANDFHLAIAGRTLWTEQEEVARQGYARLFADMDIAVDADDAARLVLFPEMDAAIDVPEITVQCWDILGVPPETMMCATSRMVVKRKGAEKPTVVPCTLLPYEKQFEMGEDLVGSAGSVSLNHPHCAKFCVLGGGACSVE